MHLFTHFRLVLDEADPSLRDKIVMVKFNDVVAIVEMTDPLIIIAHLRPELFTKRDIDVSLIGADGVILSLLVGAVHLYESPAGSATLTTNSNTVFYKALPPVYEATFADGPLENFTIAPTDGKSAFGEVVAFADALGTRYRLVATEPCTAAECDGLVVGITFNFTAANPVLGIHYLDFQLARMPVPTSFIPTLADFSATAGCVPYTMTVSDSSKAVPVSVQLSVAGIEASSITYNPEAMSYGGCLTCTNCGDGDATISLVAVGADSFRALPTTLPTIRVASALHSIESVFPAHVPAESLALYGVFHVRMRSEQVAGLVSSVTIGGAEAEILLREPVFVVRVDLAPLIAARLAAHRSARLADDDGSGDVSFDVETRSRSGQLNGRLPQSVTVRRGLSRARLLALPPTVFFDQRTPPVLLATFVDGPMTHYTINDNDGRAIFSSVTAHASGYGSTLYRMTLDQVCIAETCDGKLFTAAFNFNDTGARPILVDFMFVVTPRTVQLVPHTFDFRGTPSGACIPYLMQVDGAPAFAPLSPSLAGTGAAVQRPVSAVVVNSINGQASYGGCFACELPDCGKPVRDIHFGYMVVFTNYDIDAHAHDRAVLYPREPLPEPKRPAAGETFGPLAIALIATVTVLALALGSLSVYTARLRRAAAAAPVLHLHEHDDGPINSINSAQNMYYEMG
jgi:hypothetical protein